MSLLGLSSLFGRHAAHRHPAVAPGSGEVADHCVTPVVYLLVYNSPRHIPGAHGRGWTLIARCPADASWRIPLAAHGAGVHAGPRIAKAVAVRVLTEKGVHVDGWDDYESRDHHRAAQHDEADVRGECGDITVSRARLARPTPPCSPGHSEHGHVSHPVRYRS